MSSRLIAALICLTIPACSNAEPQSETNAAVSLAVGERPRAITAADFNDDGQVDIAVANADSDSVSIMIQLANNGFSRTDYPAGNEPADIAYSDVNKDGHLDLIVANHETSGVTVLINSGDGQFSPMDGSPFDTMARPHLHSVAVGDFNDDSFIDVAADSSDTDSIAVLFGRADGFQPSVQVGVGEFPYYRLGTLPYSNGLRVLVPSPRAHRVAQVDLADDNTVEIVGEATGAVMARSADFDGNGVADAVAIFSDGIIMWSHVDGEFRPLAKTPVALDNATELAVGDLDGDGRDEVIVGLWDSDQIHVLSNNGENLGQITACHRPAALEIADLDGDNEGDIIAGCWDGAKIMIIDASTILAPR